jgi:WD40 repeat protein
MSGTVAVLLAIAGLLGGLAWSNRSLRLNNLALREARERADRNAQESNQHRRAAEKRQWVAIRHLYAARVRAAHDALKVDQIDRAQGILDGIRPTAGEPDPRDFVWRYLWQLSRRDFITYLGHETCSGGVDLAWTPDMRRCAIVDDQAVIRLVDLETNGSLGRLNGATRAGEFLLFGPGGNRLVLATTGSPDKAPEVIVWECDHSRTPNWLRDFSGRYIWTLGYSADGRVLGVHSSSYRTQDLQEIRFYELRGDLVQPLPQRRLFSYGIPGFAPNTGILIWASVERVVSAIDVGNGTTIWADKTPSPGLFGMTFSADGRRVVCWVHGWGLVVRDVMTGDELARLDYPGHVAPLGLSRDGSTLAAAPGDGSGDVYLHDIKPNPKLRRIVRADDLKRDRSSSFVAFSPGATKLVLSTSGPPKGASPPGLWDVASARRLAVRPGQWDVANEARDFAFAPDGRSVLYRRGRVIQRWLLERRQGDSPDSLPGHTDEAWAVAFSPDGRFLATGSDDTDEKQTIKLWDPATGQFIRGWFAGEGTVASLSFSRDGKRLASAHLSQKENVRVWDVKSGELVVGLPCRPGPSYAVAFSPVDSILASGQNDPSDREHGVVRLWDSDRWKPLGELKVTGQGGGIEALDFSPDGLTIAAAGYEGVTRLWRVSTGESIATLSGSPSSAVAFAPDGASLATADSAGKVVVWEADTKSRRLVLPVADDKLLTIVYSPNGGILAAAGMARKIYLWDALTGQELLTLEGHKTQINGLAFSPDGSLLASCSHDGAVKLWRGEPSEAGSAP